MPPTQPSNHKGFAEFPHRMTPPDPRLCIGRDTAMYPNGYRPVCERREDADRRSGYDEQLTLRCLPQFGGGAA
jgi:hypothetical protein